MADNEPGLPDTEETCLLCDKPFGNKKCVNAHAKAIESFIEASKIRKDDKHLRLLEIKKGENVIKVHDSCRAMYVRDSCIRSSLKNRSTSISRARRVSLEARNFDFDNFCFLCTEDASESFIETLTRRGVKGREQVKFVQKGDTKSNILNKIKERSTEEHINKKWYADIKSRIEHVDLVNVQARYHTGCLVTFCNLRSSNIPGRPMEKETTELLEFIISYVQDNCETCQFSLKEIIMKYKNITNSNEDFTLKNVRNRLEEYFQDDICTYSYKGDYQFCFINDRNRILRKAWLDSVSQTKDVKELKEQIVKSCAQIILSETRELHFNLDEYPAPHYFLDGAAEQVPYFLKMFLEIIVKTHKKKSKLDNQKWDKRVLVYGHSLMSTMRPRAFVSPLLLGISSMMHKQHASRLIVDSLSFAGLCESYAETLRFEDSIANSQEQYNLDNAFLQFVFDNADHNTNTPDGRNTFHATGGIMIATPGNGAELSEIEVDIDTDDEIDDDKSQNINCNTQRHAHSPSAPASPIERKRLKFN